MLAWHTITERDLLDAPKRIDEWRQVYRSVSGALDVVERVLFFELDSFQEQSGHSRLAWWSVRTKEEDSFLSKIQLLATDERRRKAKFPDLNSATLTVFDLVTDLCGGRLIFYFERDIRDAVVFWMSFPTYEPLEVTHYVQDISGYDTAMPAAARWIKELPALRRRREVAPKESGYESLHFVMGIDVPLLEVRCDVANRRPAARRREITQRTASGAARFHLGKLLADVRKFAPILRRLTFEIQCRTIIEHTWSEVEHRARYSIVKSGNEARGTPIGQVRTFRNYKAILRAAQIFQNSIKAGFNRWDEEEAALAGRRSNVEIGPRAMFWAKEELEIIEELNAALSATIATSHHSKNSRAAAKVWKGALTAFKAAVRKLEARGLGSDLLELRPTLSPIEYGRRRLLVMLLGFILSYAPRSQTKRKGQSEKKLVSDNAATLYLENNVNPRAKDWVSPVVAPIRLYEQMKLLDAWYSGERPDDLCYDPLVHVRAASVYFRHFGSLRRSTALLEEALERVPKWRCPRAGGGWILSEKYIGHRLTENYWASFNLEGRRHDDLGTGLRRARQALLCKWPHGHENKESERIDQKLLAHILTMTLYQSVMEDLHGAIHGEEAWVVLSSLGRRVADIWARIEEELLSKRDQLLDANLRLQGFAIATACATIRAKDRLAADRGLADARRAARLARQNMEKKLRSRRGGAMEFHLEVARDIEQVVFSLCSDDWGKQGMGFRTAGAGA